MHTLNFRPLTKRVAALGILGLMTLTALLPATAFADTTPTPTTTKCKAADIACVIGKGDKDISNRLTALNDLKGKVDKDLADKKITSDQSSSLETDIATNVSGLNDLKTKLDAETTAKGAVEDYANIFRQFRIYAVVIPRDARTLEYDVETNVQTKMQAAIPAIQTAISKAPASEQDKLNNLFNDYKQQVTDAGSAISGLPNDFTQMTPTNFNTNRSSYEGIRKTVDTSEKSAHDDLHKAADDLKQMVQVVGKIK